MTHAARIQPSSRLRSAAPAAALFAARFPALFPALFLALLLALAACGRDGGNGAQSADPKGASASQAGGTRSAAAGAEIERVVLLTIDTLRADRLHCYGHTRKTSPNLDKLAAQGARFAHAQAPRGLTYPSLTTILTGKYPMTHGVRDNISLLASEHATLPEMLGAHGFTTAGFITNMTAAPNRGFDTIVKIESEETQAQWDREATDTALKWLEANKDRKFFLWVHWFDPHKPYAPEPAFDVFRESSWKFEIPQDYERPHVDGNARKVVLEASAIDDYLQYVMGRGVDLTKEQIDYVNALYDAEVLAVDHEVGRVLDALADHGLDEKTLLVFAVDHGEELFEHNHYFYHAASVYESVLHVPMMVRFPGVVKAGRVVDDLVELADIAPTILDILGLPAESEMDGASLAKLLRGEGGRGRDTAFSEWAERAFLEVKDAGGSVERTLRPIYSVRRGNWKLIHNPDEVHPTVPPYQEYKTAYRIGATELYDLANDPRETTNLAEREPERVKELRALLDQWLARMEPRAGEAAVGAKTILRTWALGYMKYEYALEALQKELGISKKEAEEMLERAKQRTGTPHRDAPGTPDGGAPDGGAPKETPRDSHGDCP